MYGGNVLSCSTLERASCTISHSQKGILLRNGSLSSNFENLSEIGLQGNNLDILVAPLLFLQLNPTEISFSLEVSTDIPMRAGLAGSTAMLAAVVGALNSFLDLKMNSYQISETIRKIEDRVMGVVCGFQDQHMAVFGGLNFMNFNGKQSLLQRDNEPLATIEPLGQLVPTPHLILAHTGIEHHSGSVHRSPRERWLAGETEVVNGYAEISQLAISAQRFLIEGNWAALGVLMNRNHEIVASLGGSGEANERLISAAREAGALGAKLAGAGGGGTIVALTHEPEVLAFALKQAGAKSIHYPRPTPGLTISF